MKKRVIIFIIIALLAYWVTVILLTTNTGGQGKTVADIADSAVHDNRIYIPETSAEEMDVWQLAENLYGIDELTTTRMLKLITIENYPDDYLLDYYCACACVTRALYPEDFMGNNIYERFGEMDGWYGDWMDDAYGIDEHAVHALHDALIDFTYVNQCNGMATPSDYIYYSEVYGIYVWN